MTKVLISLLACAGWSGPLLFPNPEDRFSRVKAHFMNFGFPVNPVVQFYYYITIVWDLYDVWVKNSVEETS